MLTMRSRSRRVSARGARLQTNLRRSNAANSCGLLRQRLDPAVDDFLDQQFVVALGHHANHRLGAGGPHYQPALAVEAFVRDGDRGLYAGVLQRLAGFVMHVFHYLRQRIEAVAYLRHRPVLPLEHREQLQRGDEGVAGRGVVGEGDVAGRFAADVEAVPAHVLEDVTVADRGARERKTETAEVTLEPEVRHHGGDHAGLRKAAVFLPALGD